MQGYLDGTFFKKEALGVGSVFRESQGGLLFILACGWIRPYRTLVPFFFRA